MNRVVSGLVVVALLAMLTLDLTFVGFYFYGAFLIIPLAGSPLALVGALLVARVPRNVVSWLLALAGLLFELTFAAGAYAWAALIRDPGTLPLGEVAAAIGNGVFPPALGCVVLMLLFFPSGQGLGGRWTWLERAVIVLVAVSATVDLFKDVPLQVSGPLSDGNVQTLTVSNPFALHGPLGEVVTLVSHPVDSWSLPIVFVGPISLFARYRRSSTIGREQIKWLAYSGTVSLALLVVSSFASGSAGDWLWGIGVSATGSLLPIAIAIAIFRYRLYDIDVLIRRTLVYAAVSAVLLATYVAGVALIQTVLAPLTAGSGVAVAISTLAVVALFQPVRTRVQAAVDRRFYRAKYDAERTLDSFAGRLRDEVDLGSVRAELLTAVGETLHPAHASVWLRKAAP